MDSTNYAQTAFDTTRIRAARSSAPTPEFMDSFKNAEGKYQCVTCDKSYLHFKHLKRHYMKHTGNRPHVCKICQDTFCRSDILKRHYSRCLAKFQVTGKCAAVSRVPKRIIPQPYYNPATATLYQKHQLPSSTAPISFQQSPSHPELGLYYFYPPANATPNSIISLQDKPAIQQVPLPHLRTSATPTAPALTTMSPVTSPIPNDSQSVNYVFKQQPSSNAYYSPPLSTDHSFPPQQQQPNCYRPANSDGFICYSDAKQQQLPQQHCVPPPPLPMQIPQSDDSNVRYVNNIYLASPRSASSSSSSSIFSSSESVKPHYGAFYQQPPSSYGQPTGASTATAAANVPYQLPPLAPGIIIATNSLEQKSEEVAVAN